MMDAVEAAFARLAAALSNPADDALVAAALAPDVQIGRYNGAPRKTAGREGAAPLAEWFTGAAAALGWFRRSPRGVQFTVAGAPERDGDSWLVEYAITVADFTGGGRWRAQLAADGRIARLAHCPFELPK